jgi:hypothetical protein
LGFYDRDRHDQRLQFGFQPGVVRRTLSIFRATNNEKSTMRISTAWWLRRFAKLLPLGAILATATAMSGQDAMRMGAPDDWTHHHLVFADPGTVNDAIRNGTYAQWARIASDPRFVLQQRKRAAVNRLGPSPTLPTPVAETEMRPAPESREGLEELRNPPARGVMPAIAARNEREILNGGELRLPRRIEHWIRPESDLQTDWSVNLGSGATVGLGIFPAKYSFSLSTANCSSAASPDFVVYNTGLAGSAAQASIVAFDNLYSGCTGTVPSFHWAYDTNGGTIVTSVTLSLDGSQVAFVQTTAGGASLVVLKWAASTTQSASAPDVLSNTAAAAYRACIAPCMTTIAFSGGANDSGSSVFYDYGSDSVYVGDDSGKLHKFSGVFAGTPAEAGSPWPVAVNTSGEGLSSPVYDPVSGHVLVGDYLVSGAANCATAGCGYLYSVTASTGAVVQSARLDYIFGIVDGPLVDSTAARAYVFVGADSGFQSAASPCGVRVACSGVFQFPTTFAAAAGGTEARTGSGYEFMLSGVLDNGYFTSSNGASPSGNLYVVGNTGAANNTLYQVPISANILGTAKAGPALSTNLTHGYYAAGLGLTEVFTGTKDYIFTSVLLYAAPAACTSSLTSGCVMGFDVTSGTISSGSTPTGATTEAGGTSGIVIDNIVTSVGGASNIYYTPLANQACGSGGTGGCAIQISQAAP